MDQVPSLPRTFIASLFAILLASAACSAASAPTAAPAGSPAASAAPSAGGGTVTTEDEALARLREIADADEPFITSDDSNTALIGATNGIWTVTTLTAGDTLRFNIDSVSSISRCTIELELEG